MSVTIYGIKNCDTVKKARAWLDSHDVAYRFHDYRADGLDSKLLDRWCVSAGWEKLLNRASTTFKDLPEASKAGLDEPVAKALMLANPTLIKRPVLDVDGRLTVGFKLDSYETSISALR